MQKKYGFLIMVAVLGIVLGILVLPQAKSPISASAAVAEPFEDLAHHWAKYEAETAVAKGWFGGVDENRFAPDEALTRGMAVTILSRIAGAELSAESLNFADVAPDAYYAPAVAWASANHLTGGTGENRFSPEEALTREQLAVLLNNFCRWQEVTLVTGDSPHFADEADIADWAKEAVQTVSSAGIMSGKEGARFDPKGTATRAETAAVLLRYEQALQNGQQDGDMLPTEAANGENIITNGGYTVALADLAHEDRQASSVVYYTNAISPEALMAIYAALDRAAVGEVAVKLSTGEAGGHYYLDPDLIKDLVQSVDGTIVECNTAYGGSRAATAMHLQVAKDHGFTAIADVDILDADGDMALPVTNGSRLKEDLVGAHLANYDFVMVLSHFKGHAMAGFGGALKNISIGIASAEGKGLIHSGGQSSGGWGASQTEFTEAMAEAAKAVSDYENGGEKMLYISVMNHLSVDCDCDAHPAEPTMQDIGILASTDPVALDQACVDLVYAVPDGANLIERMESRQGIHILEHAQALGLGSRAYHLVPLDQ